MTEDNWEFWDSAARWTPDDGWRTPDWVNAPLGDITTLDLEHP